MALAGLSVDSFSTGDWMTAATAIGGPLLGVGGGRRWRHLRHRHVQRADDELHAPAHGHGRRWNAPDVSSPGAISHEVPWVSVLLCGLAWALALNLNSNASSPSISSSTAQACCWSLSRWSCSAFASQISSGPFKAGNLAFACSLGIGPAVLIGYALYASRKEEIVVGAQYGLSARLFHRRRTARPRALLAHCWHGLRADAWQPLRPTRLSS